MVGLLTRIGGFLRNSSGIWTPNSGVSSVGTNGLVGFNDYVTSTPGNTGYIYACPSVTPTSSGTVRYAHFYGKLAGPEAAYFFLWDSDGAILLCATITVGDVDAWYTADSGSSVVISTGSIYSIGFYAVQHNTAYRSASAGSYKYASGTMTCPGSSLPALSDWYTNPIALYWDNTP